MNEWGTLMLQGCDTVARMAAIGFGLPETTFVEMMQQAPHLLAPTGSDIGTLPVGTVMAGLHYDLNFLTIHGKSRYPGLSAWMRGGKKFSVSVPEGCLLLQAGKQMEWLTGGAVFAGFHEVVVTETAKERATQFKAKGRPQWRVSSTLFSHIASDRVLQPMKLPEKWIPHPDAATRYPPTKAGKQVADELAAIKLARPTLPVDESSASAAAKE
jgi:isopenicillin N synthase-like dioxygenase